MQIFIYIRNIYNDKISYHNFIQIDRKDNMMMAVDINDDIYTWNNCKYLNGYNYQLL